MTAAEVAEELEVSERTARRDLDALGLAGLPIYSVQGRNGGWRLAGDGRTDLSGLSASEARALFLVAGPSSTATAEVRAALRKLVRALPEPFRAQAEAASTALHVDARGWDQGRGERPPPPHLDALQDSVIDGVQVDLGYTNRDGGVSERRVHPLGLASKGPAWYLVAGTDAGQRTFRVSRVRSVEPLADRADRPDDFDLEAAWEGIAVEVEERRSPFRSRVIVRDRGVLDFMQWSFAKRLEVVADAGDGDVVVELRSQSATILAHELAGLGGLVEAEHPDVRAELGRIGRELSGTYRDS